MSKHGDLSSSIYKVAGLSDDIDRSSQEDMIYQFDKDGDYIRLKGKKCIQRI